MNVSDNTAIAAGTATVAADVAAVEGDIFGLSAATDSGVLAQSADDAAAVTEDKFMRPKRSPSGSFNIAIIVAAALVFIVVIAWFESLRIWIEYAFNSSTKILFNKAIGDLVYAAVATVIAILLIFLLVKFWIC